MNEAATNAVTFLWVFITIFGVISLGSFFKKEWFWSCLTGLLALLALGAIHQIKQVNTPGQREEVRFERLLHHMNNEYSVLVEGEMQRKNFGRVKFLYDAKVNEKSWCVIQKNLAGEITWSEFHLHNPKEIEGGDFEYKTGQRRTRSTHKGSTTVVE